MSKRIIALLLCLIMCASAMAGCSRGTIDVTDEDKGEQIIMYLSENVYDLDPTRAYVNESTRAIVSLLFDTLFVLDEKGKVQPSLAESYTISFVYLVLSHAQIPAENVITVSLSLPQIPYSLHSLSVSPAEA